MEPWMVVKLEMILVGGMAELMDIVMAEYWD